MRVQDVLLTYAPDFCWMTMLDLLKLAEQIDEDVDENVFKVTLCRLTKAGKFNTRPWPYSSAMKDNERGRSPRLYIRVN